jgi:photosystem II stability/assembly factor-like uncharacterized protein
MRSSWGTATLGTVAALPVLLLVLMSGVAAGHDPSAYGGLFRSRDDGATWLPANPGRIVSGAIAVAVDPADSTHLLLGTDSGLLRSRNGGLDWTIEASSVLVGSVFAVVFGEDGRRALASTGIALFRTEDGLTWRGIESPPDAAPARALAAVGHARVYLAGWRGFHRSDDWGTTWTDISAGLPDEPVSAVVPVPGSRNAVHAIAGGQLWSSLDAGLTWRLRESAPPGARLEAAALDVPASQVWAAGMSQVYRSDDRDERLRPWGRDLGEPAASVRGLAIGAAGAAVILATDRGLFRTADGGGQWTLVADTLPAHLEAGPLVRDPADAATLYAGFALIPYAELWRLAAERQTALGRIGPAGLAGGAAFFILLALAATAMLRALSRRDRVHLSPGSSEPRRRARRPPEPPRRVV